MFALIATVAFAFICFIWSSKDIINVFIKLIWAVLMFWAAFEALKAFGYIIKG